LNEKKFFQLAETSLKTVKLEFGKLKDFYDAKDKLSVHEAVKDYSIKMKLLQIYKIFYDDTSLAGPKINECLEKIGKSKTFSKRGYNEN